MNAQHPFSRLTGQLALALWLVSGTAACADAPVAKDPEPVSANPADTADAQEDTAKPDPSCHWDCFGSTTCSSGKVVRTAFAAVPCDKWTGSCPLDSTYSCKSGCGVPPKNPNTYMPLAAWCSETAKLPGVQCKTDGDCSPVQQPPGLPGDATPVTMSCVVDELTCGASSAPVVPDFMAPCGIEAFAVGRSANYTAGQVVTPACSGGVCMVVALAKPLRGLSPCLRQGCTVPCKTAWDCPAGSVCKYASTYDPVTGRAIQAPGTSICVPGRLLYSVGMTSPCDNWIW